MEHNGLIIEALHKFFLTSVQLYQRNQFLKCYLRHNQFFSDLFGDIFKC